MVMCGSLSTARTVVVSAGQGRDGTRTVWCDVTATDLNMEVAT